MMGTKQHKPKVKEEEETVVISLTDDHLSCNISTWSLIYMSFNLKDKYI